jgi:hypothetical protein
MDGVSMAGVVQDSLSYIKGPMQGCQLIKVLAGGDIEFLALRHTQCSTRGALPSYRLVLSNLHVGKTFSPQLLKI